MSYTYLWVGIALATVAVFAIFQSVLAAGYYSTQAARHEALAEAVSARKDLERRLSQETNSRNLDQGDYDTFMAMVAADNAAAYQDLEQYNNEQTEIPDDVAARVEQTHPETDGVRFLDLWDDQSIPSDYMTFLSRDDQRQEIVSRLHELDGNTPQPGALSESLETVPHLLQWDARWAYLPYGTSNMLFAGCAPTCLSMVFSYLNQDPAITPYAVAQFSEQAGDYVDGIGTAHSLLGDAANNWGIQFESIAPTREMMEAALNAGDILVLSMNPGDFTRVGHFIVVTGMENGQFQVLDPNSDKNTRLWDAQTVADQCGYAWAYWRDQVGQ
ncbi:C39 family peptidase [uncultured Faecalibaculum sp.]|uniref:C39 family peptidase n=1 Tax=uncultured Faecalibaculum sp. TaxID=1729681 RepID=UPI0025DF9551|nr:C39 family peptidase [uncultured Faecalibaculum sp.]